MLRLRTFGGIGIDGDPPLAGRSSGRRRLALLALLAVARERGMTRDKVLGYLWPERDSEHARHALSQTLYALRRELGDEAVIAGVDDLRLNPAVLASDVGEFDEALERGDSERAIRLYTGPFLDGFFVSDAAEFERWAESKRERLARAYAAALEVVADAASRSGDRQSAVDFWRRRAALEPLNSRVAQRLMSALVEAGDPAGALQHARVHALLREQELQAPPDPAVAELAERVLSAARTPTEPTAAAPQSALQPYVAVAPPPEASPTPPSNDGSRAAVLVPSVARHSVRVAGMAAVFIAALTLLATGVLSARRERAAASPDPRLIVVSDIRGTDSTLGLAVYEALRAELESHSGIRTLGEGATQETLQLMRLPSDTIITAAIALEIAQRRGAPLVIVGSATPLGTGAQLVAQLVDAETATPVATVTERPTTAGDVIPAVARLARTLRDHVLGTSVAGPLRPLPAVTTSSLAALRNFALARQAVTRLDRQAAIALLEAAIAHDSLFALAHYLVGDLLWYVDNQIHSEVHLNTALRLSDRLLPRERLLVRARHAQIVRDRPDSALFYWRQLRVTYPDEPLAHEGLIWTYMALDRWPELAAAAETAAKADRASPFMARIQYESLLAAGDTTAALRAARATQALVPDGELHVRLAILQRRGEWEQALRLVDSAQPRGRNGAPNPKVAPSRQGILLALGRVEDARREMEVIVQHYGVQAPPRAWLFQAHGEAAWRGPTERAKALTRRGLDWIEGSDIYPPSVSRLVELAATAAARTRDTLTIAAARRLVLKRDAARGLRSYQLALLTIDACSAFARANMRLAAELTERSLREPLHGRSRDALMLLEADARTALGDRARADSLYRAIIAMGSMFGPLAQRALANEASLHPPARPG